ncbi:tetraprenyl-beta-curcumene synthase family protein [Inediibacterium massiliense]|uniref:tetraprenyl-beta-curcumene synthase family protein n=1 Tax=Inediibacterium massiliense TaxID=1658111 RepID=UPI0006B54613|nr:tetraprenyl-beta-curcumene synthase family protein [Inediibacterium massiliense]
MKKSIYQSKLIYKFVKEVFPQVKNELFYWKDYAQKIPDPILCRQAVDSIQKKSFHAQGGCIYSLYKNKIDKDLIKFIVALQTISDYLDNLCDRAGIEDKKAFYTLHQAILDALRPDEYFYDYYKEYPYKNDGGYLFSLVHICKSYIKTLPSYSLIEERVLYLGTLYSQMQSYKHISLSKREEKMKDWSQPYLCKYQDLSTWEFSAASGSTLCIFLLCTLAKDKNLDISTIDATIDAYFPWICGFHILLDYFIDQNEDNISGDLNFVSFYENEDEKRDRIIYFLKNSYKKAQYLKNPLFHISIIEGLIAMYLSDPKTKQEKEITKNIIKSSSLHTKILYQSCKLLRKQKII